MFEISKPSVQLIWCHCH